MADNDSASGRAAPGPQAWFQGNYSDYEADRKHRLGKDADAPHRIRYRRLVRE